MQNNYLGLDIGGANVKAIALGQNNGELQLSSDITEYFPFWERKPDFASFLREKIASAVEENPVVGVTMTAELSDCFNTKAEGVEFICSAVDEVFPGSLYYTVSGQLINREKAEKKWMEVSAANWHAAALLCGDKYPDSLFIDMGSTTTDIIPIINGIPVTTGKDDVNRLISGELLYTGAQRSTLTSLVGLSRIPFGKKSIRGSAEYFACTADVYRILGMINGEEYTVDTPDGRGKTVEDSMSRVAKFICGDTQILDYKLLNELCEYLKDRQIDIIAEAIKEVLSTHDLDRNIPVMVTGCGSFIVEMTAKKMGFSKIKKLHGSDAGIKEAVEFSPALAVAIFRSRLEN
ncbi:MAG: hydantoinase/oxoprolinase family protein [Candidatus Hodarchaeales archaeon]